MYVRECVCVLMGAGVYGGVFVFVCVKGGVCVCIKVCVCVC